MALKAKSAEEMTKARDLAPVLRDLAEISSTKTLDAKSLKGLLSYLSYLYSEGEISERAFEALVRYAYSTYVENKVESRIQQLVSRYPQIFTSNLPLTEINMSSSNPESKGELSKSGNEKGAEQDTEESPAELANAFKELPPEGRRIVNSLVAQFSSGPVPSPIAQKITSEHISQLIANDEGENEREYRRFLVAETTRRWALGGVVAVIVIVLTYAGLTKDKDLSEKIINVGIGALGGGSIGYVAGRQKKDK